MAGTATSPRRWILPSALVVVLIACFGDENATPSYVADAGEGQYWRCPRCKRVELWPDRETPPRCTGEKPTHGMVDTDLVEGETPQLTDSRTLFK